MNKRKPNKLAQQIIAANVYLTMATVDAQGKPWICPLYYYVDKTYTFYYASQLKSVHSKNILSQSRVACAIFASNAKEGTGIGVQMLAKAQRVTGKEFITASKKYIRSQTFITPEMLDGKGAYRLFKIVPKKIYVTDTEAKVDKRVKVSLSELQKN